MKKRVWSLVVAGLMIWNTPSFAASTSVDALIQKLVDKKILTDKEALELKGEIAADEKLVREEGFKQSLPSWVQGMKWKGDLRVRYQNERRDSTNSRNRGRIRMRLGVETKVNEKVVTAIGIATGSGDPRSTNATLENSFEKSSIRLDYAYAKYSPTAWASVTGGKMLAPFWNAKDLKFDSDISFDGASANLKSKKFWNDRLEYFFNTGFFILDENATENYDPYLYVMQPGFSLKTTETTALKLAAAYYGIDSIRNGTKLAHSSGTNTGLTSSATSTYAHSYDPIGADAEFTMDYPMGIQWIPQLAFFGEYIQNTSKDKDEHDQGWLAGARIGDKKISGPKQWQLFYNFRRLERNATLDIFPDSDSYGGGTHIQGHEAGVSYGLGKNVSIDLDYYRMAPIGGEEIDTRQAAVENLIQADVNFKF